MSFAAFTKRMAADQGRIHWQPEHYQLLAKHYGVSEEQVAKAVRPAPAITSPFPEAVTKSAPADVQRSFRWVMNDGEIDRAGDIVVAAGVDTSHFKSNPIALLSHDPTKYIGTWSGVHADGGKLKGTLNLAPTRLGEHVRENIAAGVLKAASIGFVPMEFEPMKSGGFRFDKIELMETSVVSLPASRGSLRERSLEERKAALKEDLAECKAKAAQYKREDAAYAAKAAAERRRKGEEERRINAIPEIAAGRARLAAAEARRRERELTSRMNPVEHANYLNEKLRFKERMQERKRDLERIRAGGTS